VRQQVRRGSLRRRIVAWAVVPTALILIAVGLFTLYTYQQVTEDLVTERSQELTLLLVDQLGAELQDYVQRLISLASTLGMIYRNTPSRLRCLTAKQELDAPILAKGNVLGIINVGRQTPRDISPDELTFLAAIGQQTDIAVENARLYEKAEESAANAERSRLARELHDAVTQPPLLRKPDGRGTATYI